MFVVGILEVPWDQELFSPKIFLFSLPRDLWLQVPCSLLNPILEGNDRINSSWAWGEEDCTRQTIEANFPIEVNMPIFYTTFDGFIALIDTMDGIEIIPTETHTEWCGVYHGTDGESGGYTTWTEGKTYYMDGQMALCYARGRKGSELGDLDRNRRHIELLLAMWEQYPDRLLDFSDPLLLAAQIVDVWSWSRSFIESDTTGYHIAQILPHIPEARDAELYFYRMGLNEVAFWTTPVYGASVLVPKINLYDWMACILEDPTDISMTTRQEFCTLTNQLPDEERWDLKTFDD